VVHGLAAAELRVGHVEEVRAPGGPAQCVPGLLVGDRVAVVSRLAPELHRDRPVPGRREHEQELLQVGAVVLRVAIRDERPLLATDAPTPCLPVLPAEPHRGRVVVQLIELQAEGARCRHDHVGQQGTPVGIEEVIQCTPDRVVADVAHGLGRHHERLGANPLTSSCWRYTGSLSTSTERSSTPSPLAYGSRRRGSDVGTWRSRRPSSPSFSIKWLTEEGGQSARLPVSARQDRAST